MTADAEMREALTNILIDDAGHTYAHSVDRVLAELRRRGAILWTPKPSPCLADGDIVANAKWIAGMLDELAAHEGAGPGFRGLGEKVVELAAEYAAMVPRKP